MTQASSIGFSVPSSITRPERNEGALSITGDEAFAFTEYVNDTDLWILGLPKRRFVTDEGGQTFAETSSYYDGPDYIGLASGQVTRGNLTRQEAWVEGSTYVNLVRSAYDTYGNVIGIMDPNGNLRTIVYDDVLHSFPVQENIVNSLFAEDGGSVKSLAHCTGLTTKAIKNNLKRLDKIIITQMSPAGTQYYLTPEARTWLEERKRLFEGGQKCLHCDHVCSSAANFCENCGKRFE